MPELPEAEYMVRRLEEYARGAAIHGVRILRDTVIAPQSARQLRRRACGTIVRCSRRAKNVLLHLDTGWTIRIILGMTGHVYWIPRPAPAPRFTRVLFLLDSGAALAFEDARTFGRVGVHQAPELAGLLAEYGPEPLDQGFRWTHLCAAAGGLTVPVKSFLLDQRRIAGLGNIWAAESLFLAGIAPQRRVDSLLTNEWRALHSAIRRVLRKAIVQALRVAARPGEFPDAALLRLWVYGRAGQPCRKCAEAVVRRVLAGRATFYCPVCQV